MRPPLEEITTRADFIKWYWLKEELVAICITLGLPKNGSKFELRDRIAHFIDTGEILKKKKIARKQSTFNWAKEVLSLETVITDNVSFGPNFRKFMKQEIGSGFTCTSEFMDWVKTNPGKTLEDAIMYWEWLESRKQDVSFKREIAPHNMYSQYIRDYCEANPGATMVDVKASWMKAKQEPSEDGFVRYGKKG